jgi:hypothetical protein
MRLLFLCLTASSLLIPVAAQQLVPPSTDIKITFASPQQPAPGYDFSLPRGASYLEGRDSIDHSTTFAQLVANHITGVEVAWADDFRFRSEGQISETLNELLNSPKTIVYTDHVWSWGDGRPDILATVTHSDGSKGKWVIWIQPTPYWAYQDQNGLWWWGIWANDDSPRPASANIPGITPLPTTTVSGHVIDDATDQPMAGAHVDISAGGIPCDPKDVIARDAPIPDCIRAQEEHARFKPVVTGKDGAFLFKNVPIGQLTIHAEKPFLKDGEFLSRTIGPRDAPKPLEIDLHLSSASSTQQHK